MAGSLAVIGAGSLGESLIRGILRAGLARPEEVRASRRDRVRLRALAAELGVTPAASNVDAVRGAETVLLVLKPPPLPGVLAELRDALTPAQLVISTAAGATIASLEAALRPGVPVVRAMPNLPAAVGAGATAVAGGTCALPEHLARALAVFSAVGLAVSVEERLLDAVTGLSGSGPAYVCLAIEALADAGVQAGLPRALALRLAAQAAAGTGRLVLETGACPRTVPTDEGTPVGTPLPGADALRAALVNAVCAAAARAAALSTLTPER